jgi:hypothetical protein
VLYGVTFLLLAALLFRRGGRYRLPGALALIGAVATPICDFVENGQTLDLLPADGEGHIASSALESLQHVSYLKWGLSAGTVFLIGFLFLGSRRTIAVYAVAALVYAVTLFGLAALVFTSPGWITIYFKALGAILLFCVLPLCLGSRTWLLTGY